MISIADFGKVLCPVARDKRLLVLLTYYFDESYNSRSFILSGWIGPQGEWDRVQSQWNKRLELERRKHGKLARFHATHCNRGCDDYEGWSTEDRVDHVKALLRIMTRRDIGVVSAGIDLHAMQEIFPGTKEDPLAGAYAFTTRQAMIMIGREVLRENSNHRVAIIHDWANAYNSVINRAFTTQKDSPRWSNGKVFTTIAPLHWQDSVCLQSADMIAFDTFKLLDQTLKQNSARMRKSLEFIVGCGTRILARYLDRKVLQLLKDNSDRRLAREAK